MTKDFRSNGGIIQQDDEAQRYLDFRDADGITLNERLIILRKNPSYTELLEELEHTKQHKEQKILLDIDFLDRLEIEAKRNVLKRIHKYDVPEIEIEDLEKNIAQYQRAIERRRR